VRRIIVQLRDWNVPENNARQSDGRVR